MKKVLSLVIGMFLLIAPIYAYAAETEIVYQDGAFDTEYKELLSQTMTWMPGDTVSQTYLVKNQSKDKVRMYLKLSSKSEMSEETKEWVQIHICSKQKGWQYTFSPAETASGIIDERIELGVFSPGQVNDLTLETTLSKLADNRCKEMVTELEYELVAEVLETDAPKTGDTEAWPYVICLASGIILFVFAHKKSKQNAIEN